MKSNLLFILDETFSAHEGRKPRILSIALVYNRKTLNFHRLKASHSVHVQVYVTMLLSEVRQRCTLLPVNSHHALSLSALNLTANLPQRAPTGFYVAQATLFAARHVKMNMEFLKGPLENKG